jgi:hypothetical protein
MYRFMKNTNILKSFGDLPSVTTQVADASAPTTPESAAPPGDPTSEDFREMMQRRYTTAFRTAIPNHRWGLNE